jgi:tetratricopeptide (TPR) repeat protein
LQAQGAELKEAEKLYLRGQYVECAAMANQALERRGNAEGWSSLLVKSLLASGQYSEAYAAATNALAKDRWDIRVQWLAREAFLHAGQSDRAGQMVDRIIRSVTADPADYRDALSLVAFARAALLKGADPKRVLDGILEPARKADPKEREVYLVSGELALEKHDYALAAQRFEAGLKELPDDPDFHFGMARSYGPSDHELMSSALEATLSRNSNHIGALLLLADTSINAEDYSGAEAFLDRVTAVNPWKPEAWAYRAVIAHLRNQPETEREARDKALRFWSNNPAVDHLIGRKLSQNYRFTEGSEKQRQALDFDPEFLPAKTQLAQDLLRLGYEDEGWQLANDVQKQDAYDVEAYNLMTLRETMRNFVTLSNEHFIVRMGRGEADIYGDRVLSLLEQARSNLCLKYDLRLDRFVTIEIFPEQKDFAVRTFGMPGNPGYLGVCFGQVVTANSPAANPGGNINWEAVLWHEFCHVITLNLTRNKMPRWLSEGISVHEEREANAAWGQRMTPTYREMILGGEMWPVGRLSAAFLSPASDLHLQFAYYESSLVVDFLIERFGMDKLRSLLRELGAGVTINEAIAKNTGPMEQVEKEFELFARKKAQQLAPGLDWEKPEPAGSPGKTGEKRGSRRGGRPSLPLPSAALDDEQVWRIWAVTHPTNFWVMSRRATEFVEKESWTEARSLLQTLTKLYPDWIGEDSGYLLLARAHRALGESEAEGQALSRLAEQDDRAAPVYLRLMELESASTNWPAVARNANRYLAVNPLVPAPHKFLAEAAEHMGDYQVAAAEYRALLQLSPADPAELHYRLALLLHRIGDVRGATRHVLQSLEEAPRYADALRLLLQLRSEGPRAQASNDVAMGGSL